MSDNQNNLRGLKYLVIFMGVLIIAGVLVIISTIYRINDETLFTSDNSDISTPTNIKLPDNADISNINSNSETLTIHYTIKGKNFIGIFSIKNGENIKKFSIN
jgi:cytoskeletal protein RodZ